MFDIARHVMDWRSEGRAVVLARLVDSVGFSSQDPAAVVAWTLGLPLAGTLFAGAADEQLVQLLSGHGQRNAELSTITVADADAMSVGLSCGGNARVLIQRADDIDDEGWQRLSDREASCLVTRLPNLESIARLGSDASETAVYSQSSLDGADLDPAIAAVFARGATTTQVLSSGGDEWFITALWPTPTLLVVGSGLIAEALNRIATLLGWRSMDSDDSETAVIEAANLRTGDGFVVLSHDLVIAGPALRAALSGPATYVGALGSRRTQAARSEWLSANGTSQGAIARIHGPAGLDIGAQTPYEIGIAIIAEMCAVRTGRNAGRLRDRTGPIQG
ncbi:XdhC family protein [Jatrophihabitans sp. DSM 45814]